MARHAPDAVAFVKSVHHALWVGALLALAGSVGAASSAPPPSQAAPESAVPPTPSSASSPVAASAPSPATPPVAAPASSPPLPSAAKVTARNAEARGGLAAWQVVESLAELGHLEKAATQAPRPRGAPARHRPAEPSKVPLVKYRMYLARPHKMRLEIQVEELTALQLFDGARGATITPSAQGPMVREWPAGEVAAAAGQQDLDGPLLDSVRKGTKVKVEAVEQVQGRDNYRLALTLSNGVVRHLWIDAETFLDTKIDGSRIIGDRAWATETYFGDYRKVGSLVIPHALETTVADAHSGERLVIDRVVVNQKHDDSFFAPPARPPVR